MKQPVYRSKKNSFVSYLKQRVFRPIMIFVAFLLTVGQSTVGNAAQRFKKSYQAKRNAWRRAYVKKVTARAWTFFRPAWNSNFYGKHLMPAVRLERIATDPKNRIERGFKVNRLTKGRVLFWMDVFSRYTSHQRVVHDRDNPEIVYGYIDLRPIYRALPEPLAKIVERNIQRRVLIELRNRLSNAYRNVKSRRLPGKEHGRIRRYLGKYRIQNRTHLNKRLYRIRTQRGQRDKFIVALKRSHTLIPQVEEIFQQYRLPKALVRLPFVESGFNYKAISKCGAIGMWQFMPSTARRYDPRGKWRDWIDPVRQSYSAARYLIHLRRRLPDWGTAVTAYNSGAVRLERIVRRHKVRHASQLPGIPRGRSTLGFAGKNFFPELIAVNILENYKEEVFPEIYSKIPRVYVVKNTYKVKPEIAKRARPPKRKHRTRLRRAGRTYRRGRKR